MKTQLIAKVTADGKLEIPAEVLAQLQPLTEYNILVTEGSILLRRVGSFPEYPIILKRSSQSLA